MLSSVTLALLVVSTASLGFSPFEDVASIRSSRVAKLAKQTNFGPCTAAIANFELTCTFIDKKSVAKQPTGPQLAGPPPPGGHPTPHGAPTPHAQCPANCTAAIANVLSTCQAPFTNSTGGDSALAASEIQEILIASLFFGSNFFGVCNTCPAPLCQADPCFVGAFKAVLEFETGACINSTNTTCTASCKAAFDLINKGCTDTSCIDFEAPNVFIPISCLLNSANSGMGVNAGIAKACGLQHTGDGSIVDTCFLTGCPAQGLSPCAVAVGLSGGELPSSFASLSPSCCAAFGAGIKANPFLIDDSLPVTCPPTNFVATNPTCAALAALTKDGPGAPCSRSQLCTGLQTFGGLAAASGVCQTTALTCGMNITTVTLAACAPAPPPPPPPPPRGPPGPGPHP